MSNGTINAAKTNETAAIELGQTGAIMKTRMTLAQHAELWCRDIGRAIPVQGTLEWRAMYNEWVDWAFEVTDKIRKNRKVLGKSEAIAHPEY